MQLTKFVPNSTFKRCCLCFNLFNFDAKLAPKWTTMPKCLFGYTSGVLTSSWSYIRGGNCTQSCIFKHQICPKLVLKGFVIVIAFSVTTKVA